LINGSEDVRNHRFYKALDFKSLEKRQMLAPYVPKDIKEPNINKERGLRLEFIPESLCDVKAPEIKPANDIFLKWF
jgi:hypothetical protein